MIIEYTGRHTTITPTMKTQAEAALDRISRIANRCTHAHIILTEDKHRMLAEVTMQCRGESLAARCEANDMDAALHGALEKLEVQVVKHKDRYMTVRDHGSKESQVPAA
jgi:putative sigma-54 modulation protein